MQARKVMSAIWKGAVVAESSQTVLLEGNHYFPSDSVNKQYFIESDHHTTCPYKGLASYYSLKVNDEINSNAAWYYPEPKSQVKQIKDHVAFWKGVKVVEKN